VAADDDPTDLELLQRWRDGDKRAGARLYRRHFAGLYSFLRGRFAQQRDVEDLVQESFLRLTKGIAEFRGESSVKTYLYGIAVNVYREHIRKKLEQPLEPEILSFAQASGQINTSVFSNKDEIRLLFTALRAIPMSDQDLLELHYFQELSNRELAPIFHKKANTIKSSLRLARGKLAKKYLELCGAPPDRTIDDLQIMAWLEEARADARRGDTDAANDPA
jgi:RNA polymerase sigma-70 factor (ECF subfamily)